jgi:hypothetical protein
VDETDEAKGIRNIGWKEKLGEDCRGGFKK